MDFSGKVALITGGAQGIGRAYANALLNIGMKVCISDILEDTAKEYMDSLPENHKNNVIFQKCDVSSLADFKNAFDRVISEFGRIDMLINNAGVFNEQNYMKCIEVNFIAVVNGTRLAFEHMDINKGGHGGHVINTSSEAGLDPMPLAPVYVGTKHAVVGYTRSIGAEYHFKKTGIKVKAICPGPVDTGFFRVFPTKCVDVEEAKKLAAEMKPVKPEDVAGALIKLLEDDKNGAILRIDVDGLRYV
ncbi:15-hydroxyprostaglandin dehydrogenase [NAD(+)] like protein [Argiope bruennichi]|uniref:15-hydroxyprostaglandin dehydrogenase [NAD(+)] n=1 Tax=Argiope bruennichi TaxID=94029 RepID=A0A8T0EUA9_ARGBR|nr:15-hydroxyprostaglandin dehydrogenase [NAD(+)] like protein [Argiope bruennichi]